MDVDHICDDCGKLSSDTAETWDGRYVCLSCRIDDYATCNTCGCEALEAETSDGLCPDCRPNCAKS